MHLLPHYAHQVDELQTRRSWKVRAPHRCHLTGFPLPVNTPHSPTRRRLTARSYMNLTSSLHGPAWSVRHAAPPDRLNTWPYLANSLPVPPDRITAWPHPLHGPQLTSSPLSANPLPTIHTTSASPFLMLTGYAFPPLLINARQLVAFPADTPPTPSRPIVSKPTNPWAVR